MVVRISGDAGCAVGASVEIVGNVGSVSVIRVVSRG